LPQRLIVAKPIWQRWSRQPAPKKPQGRKWSKPLLAGKMPISEPRFISAALPFLPAQQPLFHHIGVYGWRRDALARFVALPPSPLEQAEKLEQLRALEAGMTIAIGKIDTAPGGIDTCRRS
jgi:hypothetical protein